MYHTVLNLTKKVIHYEIQLFLYVLLRGIWSVSFRARCWFCVMMWRRERDLQLCHRICETLIFVCDGGSSACQQEKWSEWSHTKLSHSFRTQKANFWNTQKKLSLSIIIIWAELFFLSSLFPSLAFLVKEGYEDKIVVAHDIHTKNRLTKFGGHGYSHILKNIVPKMLRRGISQWQVDKILIDNPKRWLTFK